MSRILGAVQFFTFKVGSLILGKIEGIVVFASIVLIGDDINTQCARSLTYINSY